jgi:hypothetical protein
MVEADEAETARAKAETARARGGQHLVLSPVHQAKGRFSTR